MHVSALFPRGFCMVWAGCWWGQGHQRVGVRPLTCKSGVYSAGMARKLGRTRRLASSIDPARRIKRRGVSLPAQVYTFRLTYETRALMGEALALEQARSLGVSWDRFLRRAVVNRGRCLRKLMRLAGKDPETVLKAARKSGPAPAPFDGPPPGGGNVERS